MFTDDQKRNMERKAEKFVSNPILFFGVCLLAYIAMLLVFGYMVELLGAPSDINIFYFTFSMLMYSYNWYNILFIALITAIYVQFRKEKKSSSTNQEN